MEGRGKLQSLFLSSECLASQVISRNYMEFYCNRADINKKKHDKFYFL